MTKINTLLIALAAVGSASAFAPAPSRAFVSRPLFSEEGEAETPAAVAPVEDVPPATPTPAPAGALVPIKEETIEFTAGLIGGVVGFVVGGPIIGAIGAAAANYASKTDQEVGEVLQAVSKSSIEVYNYLATLDAKYEVLNKAKNSLEDALEKVKSADNVDPATVKKVETALENTTAKISEINEEYDLVGAGQTALGVIGDLVEKAVKKAGELNSEYQLTDKAKDALSGAVDKAKSATSK
mmetsp:Transcript_10503/g.13316  ORF Transcript_10503/g.13316 Transcript_10503/m.13316 type:complete len:240 (-) Transcript_10503:213-932(-)